jgi:hypothetical protein
MMTVAPAPAKARTVAAPLQLPVGVISAAVGVPVFLALLVSGAGGGGAGIGRGQRFGVRTLTALCAVPRDIRAPIGEEDQPRRATATLDLLGEQRRRIDGRGERRTATTGQGRDVALGAHQRARGREQQFGFPAAEGDQRDLVAAHIAIGQQQLDRTLGLGEPVQRRRARGIHHEDHQCSGLAHQLLDTQVVLAQQQLRPLPAQQGPAPCPLMTCPSPKVPMVDTVVDWQCAGLPSAVDCVWMYPVSTAPSWTPCTGILDCDCFPMLAVDCASLVVECRNPASPRNAEGECPDCGD